MKDSLKQNIRGIALLLPLIVAIILLIMVARPADRYSTPEPDDETIVAEVADTTLSMPTLREFDPNTANYRTLIEAGVPREIAVAIIRWREAGKVYRIKEDLALCYNMTDSLYFELEPYIIISKEYQYEKRSKTSNSKKSEKPTITATLEPFSLDTVTASYLRTIGFTARQADLVISYRDMIGGYRTFEEFDECYAVDSTMAARLRPYIIFPARDTLTKQKYGRITFPIEINSADSATLCKVSGIGPKSASHILYYRELLGGYYSVMQISELKVVTNENFQRILPQICCDSAKIKKININFATSKELEVHPYVSNRMLRKIINHRELKGGWSKLEEMIEDNIFSTEEAMRIAPYLDFSVSQ